MAPQAPQGAAALEYWEERARRFATEGAGLAAVCSFGMPLFYNRVIDLCQRLALARWLRVRPGMRVLDVGCGVGRWSRHLAARGASVTGIDLSPTMVAEARRRAGAAALRGACRFLVQDLAQLEAGDKFDLVLGVTVLQHILDPVALSTAVRRMVEHLDPNGLLVLLEAAPARAGGRCDSAIFRARPRSSYLQLFAEHGLEVRATSGVDPAPFRTWMLPHLPRLPGSARLAALAAVTALSMPIDVPFGRLLVNRSWHAVFVLAHARAGKRRGCCRLRPAVVSATRTRQAGRVRIVVAVGVLLLLSALAGLGWWYQTRQQHAPGQPGTLTVDVTSAADRGPGTLREALFIVAAANGRADVRLKVKSIAPETALPPLVNPHGVHIIGEQGGTQIDGHALSGSPLLDVAGANTSIEGLRFRNCPASAILLRAAQFRLRGSTIEGCDVGVDVAENAVDLILERNLFSGNRVGVRFAASTRNAVVVGNTFSHSRDAGVWAVRAEPDVRGNAIAIHENHFDGDRSGVVAANVGVLIERNQFEADTESGVHLLGSGAVVRGNHVTGGAGMGVMADNASDDVIDNNELDHLGAYGAMVRSSASVLVRANRIHNCAYGLAFVLGDPHRPSTAADNTIISPQFNGIDVVGDSPVLRNNQVLQARAYALHVVDFVRPDGVKVTAHPTLENNNFRAETTAVAAGARGTAQQR
jgi:SAM-dependent methyltransferase